MEYLVIVEKGDTSYGAYLPDLPGCVAVGDTKEEAMELIREAVELHLESLRENGEQVPEPHSVVEKIAVQRGQQQLRRRRVVGWRFSVVCDPAQRTDN